MKREIHPDGGGHGKNFAHRHKRRHHPEDKLSGKDCWIPDYCDPDKFEYRVCKLRLRNRKGKDTEWACPDGYFCEELDCENKCWLPSTCTCHPDGHEHEGRMVCSDDCYQKQSTQWGLCVPEPEGWDGDDDEPLPSHFHFWSADHLLYNAKLHLNEDSRCTRRTASTRTSSSAQGREEVTRAIFTLCSPSPSARVLAYSCGHNLR